MRNSKTWVYLFSSTVVSLVLITAVTFFAGQASCVAEVGAQSDQVEASGVSMPPAESGVSSEAANRAIYGQRYIGLYEGDSFVGNETVTREQLLVILDRVLRDIEGGEILVESSDVQLLRTLVIEVQDEIVSLNHRLQVLDAEMQERHKRDVVVTEQTLQVKEEVNDLMDELRRFAENLRQFVLDQAASNREELDAAAEDLSRLDEQAIQIVHEIEELQASLKDSTVDLVRRLDGLKHEQDVLLSRFSALRTDTVDLRDDLVSRIDSLEEQLASMADEQTSTEATMAAKEQRIKQLEHQLAVVQTQYEEDLKSMNDRILMLSARLSALESGTVSSSIDELSGAVSSSPPQSSGE